MNTLIAVNAGLVGLFGFASIHYGVKWWFSREQRAFLVFSIQCGLYSLFCLSMISLLRVTTVPDAQACLDRCFIIGSIINAVVVNFYAVLGGRRDRALRGLVTGVLISMGVLNLWLRVRGTVIELHAVALPGGGTVHVPIRTPPGVLLVLNYLAVLAAHGYGLFVARMTWKRDRTGAVFVTVGTSAALAGAVIAFLVDFAKLRAPFPGAVPHVIFVICMALYLARDYAARGARLAASEKRAARSLRETQQALADLEESEAARHRAMEAVVQAQRTELASQLAAGVAHDFNNVLTVIDLWSRVLLEGPLSPKELEKARGALAEAQAQGHSLSRQLMALARPVSRSVKRFSLDSPIRATVQTLMPSLPRGIQLECDAPAALEVEADETEIRQVIYNLVLNARDAMPGGGTIQVRGGLETSSISIAVVGGTLSAGRWATLSVSDSGPGVDPAIRERIFDLFFTTKGQAGTGLGLATVLRIAKANGGGIVLQSKAGSGATFKLYLPACESSAATPARAVSENNSPQMQEA